jgi:hypothetical protein
MGDGRWEIEDGRWEIEDGSWEMEDGSCESLIFVIDFCN